VKGGRRGSNHLLKLGAHIKAEAAAAAAVGAACGARVVFGRKKKKQRVQLRCGRGGPIFLVPFLYDEMSIAVC